MTRAKLEGLCRAVSEVHGGNAEQWRGLAKAIRESLPVMAPFLTASTALELITLFSHDVGAGPTDPDPGF